MTFSVGVGHFRFQLSNVAFKKQVVTKYLK